MIKEKINIIKEKIKTERIQYKESWNIILTTTENISGQEYEVLSLVYSFNKHNSIGLCLKEMKRSARKFNADAIVSIKYFESHDGISTLGTAVKFIQK